MQGTRLGVVEVADISKHSGFQRKSYSEQNLQMKWVWQKTKLVIPSKNQKVAAQI